MLFAMLLLQGAHLQTCVRVCMSERAPQTRRTPSGHMAACGQAYSDDHRLQLLPSVVCFATAASFQLAVLTNGAGQLGTTTYHPAGLTIALTDRQLSHLDKYPFPVYPLAL